MHIRLQASVRVISNLRSGNYSVHLLGMFFLQIFTGFLDEICENLYYYCSFSCCLRHFVAEQQRHEIFNFGCGKFHLPSMPSQMLRFS